MEFEFAETPVTVEGVTYMLSRATMDRIVADRAHAASFRRGGMAPASVRVMTALRKYVETTYGVDHGTAYWILREAKSAARSLRG